MGERVVGWMVSGGVVGILSAVGGTVIGWFAGNLLYGLVIGMGVGMLILMAAAVKAVRVAGTNTESPSQTEPEARQDPTPQSSDWQLWQELNRLKSENEQLRSDNEQLQTALQKSDRQIAEMKPYRDRVELKWTLEAVWKKGNRLREREPPDVAAMEKWVSLTSALIRKHMSDEAATFFLVHDGDSSLAGRLHRLEQLFNRPIDPLERVDVSDFDRYEALRPYPKEW
jgi:hypothetical protein